MVEEYFTFLLSGDMTHGHSHGVVHKSESGKMMERNNSATDLNDAKHLCHPVRTKQSMITAIIVTTMPIMTIVSSTLKFNLRAMTLSSYHRVQSVWQDRKRKSKQASRYVCMSRGSDK